MALRLYLHEAFHEGWNESPDVADPADAYPVTSPSSDTNIQDTVQGFNTFTLRQLTIEPETEPGETQEPVLDTDDTTSLQRSLFAAWCYELPSDATIGGNMNVQLGVRESDAAANFLQRFYCYVWRPGVGMVAELYASGGAGITDVTSEPAATGAKNYKARVRSYATSSTVVAQAGDLIVFEPWSQNTQGSATAYQVGLTYEGVEEFDDDPVVWADGDAVVTEGEEGWPGVAAYVEFTTYTVSGPPADVVLMPEEGFLPSDSAAGDTGIDCYAFPDLEEGLELHSGPRLMADVLARRLTTRKGTLSFYPSYGIDLRDYLNESVDDAILFAIKSEVEAECEQDERVLEAEARVLYDSDNQALSVSVTGSSAEGPFSLILRITALDVSLLSEPL